MDHKRKKEGGESSVPEHHMVYCFPGDEGGQELTILVVTQRRSKMKEVFVVPSKGSTGKHAARV
eukprot:4978421-Lingulodinium_polyedra.AAC.1